MEKNKETTRKLINEVKFQVVNWLVAPFLGVTIICLLELFQRIKFLHFNRFPIWEGKLIIISNHPTLADPVVISLMRFPWMNFPWLFSRVWSRIKFSRAWLKELQKEFGLSKKLIPANTPDKTNFYDPGYLVLFQQMNVSIDRKGEAQKRTEAFFVLRKRLKNNGSVIIFPEGTRTCNARKKTISKTGKELGELKEGVALLALATGAMILPTWIQGAEQFLPNNKLPIPRPQHQVIVNVGFPFNLAEMGLSGHSKETIKKATAVITQSLLDTGDEIG